MKTKTAIFELENALSKIKNTIEDINNRIAQTSISELKDRLSEYT